MNHYLLALLSLSSLTGPGVSGAPSSWNLQTATCGSCQKLLLNGAGLFCANFSHPRGGVGPHAIKYGAVHVIQRRDYVNFL
jgi:hypothetical protein